MQDFKFITYHLQEGVATLTLNRPDKLNSLMGAMMLEMFSALGLAAQDKTVRAVVLTGAGRAFCAVERQAPLHACGTERQAKRVHDNGSTV